jgi:hypothetical protein
VWSRGGVEALGRRRVRAGDGLHRRWRQWRGAAVARDGVGARGEQGGFISARVRVTLGDVGRASPSHDGSSIVRTAGAADGPAPYPDFHFAGAWFEFNFLQSFE